MILIMILEAENLVISENCDFFKLVMKEDEQRPHELNVSRRMHMHIHVYCKCLLDIFPLTVL